MKGNGVREIIAFILLGFFAWAFYLNQHDQAMIGAILTAFAAAWGFYLGGSKTGSDTAAKNADTVAASAASNLAGPQDVNVVNPSDAPVPITETPAAPPTDSAALAQAMKDGASG